MTLLAVREQTDDIFLLIVELYYELASSARPNSNGAILSASKDVVLVSVDTSNMTSVAISNLPNLGAGTFNIKAAEETIAPASQDSSIVLGHIAANSSNLFSTV